MTGEEFNQSCDKRFCIKAALVAHTVEEFSQSFDKWYCIKAALVAHAVAALILNVP